MNGRLAKAIRKAAKKDAIQYLKELSLYPWWNRVLFAWWLVFGNKKHLNYTGKEVRNAERQTKGEHAPGGTNK